MKKKYLLLTILFLAIGFASVAVTLFVNGTIKVSANTDEFDVYFSKVLVDGVEDNTLVTDDTHITFLKEFKSFGDSHEVEYYITNGSINYDAKVSVSCSEGNDYVEVTSNWVDETVIDSTETKSGKLTMSLKRTYTGDTSLNLPVTCEITVNATERNTKGTGTPAGKVNDKLYTLIADENSNGIADIGDEIQVKGTNENFYVISNDGTILNALAKYNLNVGNMCTSSSSCTPIENPTYKQDSTMRGYVSGESIRKGTLAFSDNNGWPYSNNDTIDIQAYDGPVKTAINAYKAILPEGVEVRLITKAEIEALVNDGATLSYGSIEDKADAKGVSWLYSTSYWSGSAVAGYATDVWYVYSVGSFYGIDFGNDRAFGVRPVISLES